MNYLVNTSNNETNLFHILHNALLQNKITQNRYEQLLKQSEILFNKLMKQLNHNGSSSLSQTSFKRIWQTIDYLFCLGYALKHNNAQLLNAYTIDNFFNDGEKQSICDYDKIKQLYKEIQKEKLPFENERFHNIIEEQIPEYIKLLESPNAIFHYCHCSYDLDYPLIDGLALYHNMYEKKGAQLVRYYVERFYIEYKFCFLFKKQLPSFFEEYEKCKGISLHTISINLLEILCVQMYINICLNKSIQLSLTKEQLYRFKKQYQQIPITQILEDCFTHLSQYLNASLLAYLKTYEAILYEAFHRIILCNHDIAVYEFIDPLCQTLNLIPASSNIQFVYALNEIQNKKDIKEKIDYIKKHVHTIYDVLDLLDSNIFYEKEYIYYFSQLTTQEIATIILVLNPTPYAFHQEVSILKILDSDVFEEFTWLSYFCEYIETLPIEEHNQIHSFLKHTKLK